MNYVISGSAGFIGSNLLPQIPSPSETTAVDKVLGTDLCTTLINPRHCDIFIHLASLTSVRESLKSPQKVIIDNCKMTMNCLEYSRFYSPRFIFTSSMGAPELLSPYSASKLACENFCTTYRKTYQLNTTTLRLSNVYGPHSIHKTSVIPTFIKACINKEPLKIYGEGKQTRDFIYIDDVIYTILNCKNDPLINTASGIATSILTLAEMISQLSEDLLSYTPDVKFLPPNLGEINYIKPKTDILPITSLREGLATTFKWFIENYTGTIRC